MSEYSSKPTFRDLLLEATNRLRASGASTASLDAELLLAEAAKMSRESVIREIETSPSESIVSKYLTFIERREKQEPVAYILGRREFWSLDFLLTRSVLVPRAETEILVSETLHRVPRRGARLLDLGTGCGNVALALASEGDNFSIVATDISEEAVQIAQKNAMQLGLDKQVSFVQGDWLEPFLALECFDGVVSNPPYIRLRDWDTLDHQTLDFEPTQALLGGDDGLDAYHSIIEDAHRFLRPSGWLLMEIGMDQAQEVRDCLQATGWYGPSKVIGDLAGRDRVVVARRTG